MPKPSTLESKTETNPQLAQAVSNAMTAELFGDINKLYSQIDSLSASIEALAPAAKEVETTWLNARKQALSDEFQTLVKAILRDEVKRSLANNNQQLARATDYLNVTKTELEAVFTKMLVMAMMLGGFVGVFSAIITVYLSKFY